MRDADRRELVEMWSDMRGRASACLNDDGFVELARSLPNVDSHADRLALAYIMGWLAGRSDGMLARDLEGANRARLL